MFRRPKTIIVAFFACALVLAVGGILFWWSDFRRNNDEFIRQYHVTAERLAADLADSFRSAGHVEDGLKSTLASFCEANNVAGIVWRKDTGVCAAVGELSVDSGCFARDFKWTANGKSVKTKPRRGWFELDGESSDGGQRFAWAWVDEAHVAAVELDERQYPHRRSLVRPVAMAACLLLLPLVAAALLGVFLTIWTHRSQREALERISFVNNVSHELNTPLASIIPYAEMLRDGMFEDEADRKEALEVMIGEARRLHRLILRLLDFSRLENDKKRYSIIAFDLRETVEEAVSLLNARFEVHGITLAGESQLEVLADRDAAKEIVLNLLDNAAKYAAEFGPIEIRLEKCGANAVLTVADRGPGMDAEGMKRAFKRFWQANNSMSRAHSGLGIGLSLSLRFARGMHGDLLAHAREGGGCEFMLRLPLMREEVFDG